MNSNTIAEKESWLSKVPEATLIFWIIKMMSTTVGETVADFINVDLHLGLTGTSVVMGVALLVALVAQIRSSEYKPWLYWLCVVLISIFGTLLTDNLTDNLGVPLYVSSMLFSGALIATFVFWYISEKSLSIHTIYTLKRELFYWTAILFTFALGTAAGDLVSEGLQLGYGTATALFAGLIAATAISHFQFKMNGVLAFWIVYVLTRPLGASVGDLLSQAVPDGGLGLGAAVVNEVFLATILVLVGYLTLSKRQNSLARQN